MVAPSSAQLWTCLHFGRQPQHKLEDADLSMLGQSEKISIDKDNTTIVSGKGDSDAIKARVGQIKAQIEKTTSDYDRSEQYENLLQSGVFDPAKERESSELSPCGP